MVTSFLGGVSPLRTVEDMGEGGVKKQGKSGDVLYGRPLIYQIPLTREKFTLGLKM